MPDDQTVLHFYNLLLHLLGLKVCLHIITQPRFEGSSPHNPTPGLIKIVLTFELEQVRSNKRCLRLRLGQRTAYGPLICLDKGVNMLGAHKSVCDRLDSIAKLQEETNSLLRALLYPITSIHGLIQVGRRLVNLQSQACA